MYTNDDTIGWYHKSGLFLSAMKKRLENGETVLLIDTEASLDLKTIAKLYGQDDSKKQSS